MLETLQNIVIYVHKPFDSGRRRNTHKKAVKLECGDLYCTLSNNLISVDEPFHARVENGKMKHETAGKKCYKIRVWRLVFKTYK